MHSLCSKYQRHFNWAYVRCVRCLPNALIVLSNNPPFTEFSIFVCCGRVVCVCVCVCMGEWVCVCVVSLPSCQLKVLCPANADDNKKGTMVGENGSTVSSTLNEKKIHVLKIQTWMASLCPQINYQTYYLYFLFENLNYLVFFSSCDNCFFAK